MEASGVRSRFRGTVHFVDRLALLMSDVAEDWESYYPRDPDPSFPVAVAEVEAMVRFLSGYLADFQVLQAAAAEYKRTGFFP